MSYSLTICSTCDEPITNGNGRINSKGLLVHRGFSVPYCATLGCPQGESIEDNREFAIRELLRMSRKEGQETYRMGRLFRPNPYDQAIEALQMIVDSKWLTTGAPVKGEHGRRSEAIKFLMRRGDAWDEGWLGAKQYQELHTNSKEGMKHGRWHFISRLSRICWPSQLGLPWTKKS